MDDAYSAGRTNCAYRYGTTSAAGYVYVHICSYSSTRKSDGQTFAHTCFNQHRYAGDVTYHSQWYDQHWYNGTLRHDHRWNYDTTQRVGVPLVAYEGDQVQLKTVFTTASGVYTAAVDIRLHSYSSTNPRRDYTCDPEHVWTSGSWTSRRQICGQDVSHV